VTPYELTQKIGAYEGYAEGLQTFRGRTNQDAVAFKDRILLLGLLYYRLPNVGIAEMLAINHRNVSKAKERAVNRLLLSDEKLCQMRALIRAFGFDSEPLDREMSRLEKRQKLTGQGVNQPRVTPSDPPLPICQYNLSLHQMVIRNTEQ